MLVCLSSGDVDTGDAASYKQSTQQHSSVSREQQQQPADRLHADRSVLCQSLCHGRQQPADRLHADRSVLRQSLCHARQQPADRSVLCQSLCHARQVQSHYLEGSPVSKRSLTWEGFAEKVRFEPRVKE